MPTALYKYQTLTAYSLASLINDTVWLAQPSSFNDPFDCAITADRSKLKESVAHAVEFISKASDPATLVDKDLLGERKGDAEAYEQYRLGIRSVLQQSGILCLSEDPNSMLMWSHYANHHRGFCIQYDFSEGSRLRTLAQPVRYSDSMPSVSLADLAGANRTEALDSLWLTKAACWSYEKEWRVIMPNGGSSYQAPSPLTAVIFGARMAESERTMVKHALRHNQNVAFKEAVIQDEKFCIEIRDT